MQEFIMQHPWVIYAIIVWTLPWKGIALWKAAKKGNKIWFVILFLINILAILDIIYIAFASKEKKEKEVVSSGPTILSNGKRIV